MLDNSCTIECGQKVRLWRYFLPKNPYKLYPVAVVLILQIDNTLVLQPEVFYLEILHDFSGQKISNKDKKTWKKIICC